MLAYYVKLRINWIVIKSENYLSNTLRSFIFLLACGLVLFFGVEDEDASPCRIEDAVLWLVTLVFHYVSWYQSRLYPDHGQLAQRWQTSPTTPLVGEGLFWEPNLWGIRAGIIRIRWPTYTTVWICESINNHDI
jgi:uncharacterized membrane protein